MTGIVDLEGYPRWCGSRRSHTLSCWDFKDGSFDLERPAADQLAFAGPTKLASGRGTGAITERGTCLLQGNQWVDHQFNPVELPCDGVTSLALGDGVCFVLASGAVQCQGSNDYGRMGSGKRTFTLVPRDAVIPLDAR